ncbi:unnamed protein product [Phytophthora fragariaefolia]|uniref:Unnamed protein product n=1 Tax=Phytophthora fragariaefolia TaxID=1490495 RepID=A0A9W6TRF9_9STRA|nr:unnamed protein product [Phytophthora fragariaefolia]
MPFGSTAGSLQVSNAIASAPNPTPARGHNAVAPIWIDHSTSSVTLDLSATASPRHDGYSLDRFFAARIATQRSCKWIATLTALLKVAGEDALAPRYQRSWIKTSVTPSEDAGSAPNPTFSRFLPKHKTQLRGRNSWRK